MTIYTSICILSKDDISKIIPLMKKYRLYNHQKIEGGEECEGGASPFKARQNECNNILNEFNELIETDEEPYSYLSSELCSLIRDAITHFKPILEEELKTADLKRTKEIKKELESFTQLESIEYDWGMTSTSYHGPIME